MSALCGSVFKPSSKSPTRPSAQCLSGVTLGRHLAAAVVVQCTAWLDERTQTQLQLFAGLHINAQHHVIMPDGLPAHRPPSVTMVTEMPIRRHHCVIPAAHECLVGALSGQVGPQVVDSRS